MSISIPLTEIRRELEAKIRENKLLDALQSLLDLLPEESKKYRDVSTLIRRFNTAQQDRRHNTISNGKHTRKIDRISKDFLDLTATLAEADFDFATAVDADVSAKFKVPKVTIKTSTGTVHISAGAFTKAKTPKQGSLLYRVPHVMPLQKPTLCTVRVAISEEEILKNIVFDEHVQVKTREVSDQMSAELVDPEGGTFEIKSLNPHMHNPAQSEQS